MISALTSPKAKSVAAKTGGGLTVGAVIFAYATFAPKSDLDAVEHRGITARNEMRQTQADTWQKLMDIQLAVEANRAALDMFIKMHGHYSTNKSEVATIPR